MLLILARHGNTFGPGDKVVWVGARTDLPLVEKGRAQATDLGLALARNGISPDLVVTGPLRRTRETAAIAAEIIKYDAERIRVDQRLIEIDYGVWEGRSSEEIRNDYGAASFQAWEDDGVWPPDAGWVPSKPEMTARIDGFVDDLLASVDGDRIVLVISSNGLFRALGKWAGLAPAQAKMATGHIALAKLSQDSVDILVWNQAPGYLDTVTSGVLTSYR